MKKLFSQIINGSAMGISIGLIVSLIFSYLYGGMAYYPSSEKFIMHFSNKLNAISISIILWALMGITWNLSRNVFKIYKWNLLKQTIVHFLISFTCFTFLACLAGWFPLTVACFTIYTLLFVAIYLLIWFIARYQTLKWIKKANQKLNK